MTRQSLALRGVVGVDGSALRASGAVNDAKSGGVLAVSGAVTSQTAVITAVLYYFGWVRAHFFLGYFGIDNSMAGYGTADYVLGSITVAFTPLVSAVVIALMLIGVHRVIVAPMLNRVTSGSITPSTAAERPSARYQARSALRRIAHQVSTLARQRPSLRQLRWCLNALQAVGAALIIVVLTGVLLPGPVGAPLGLTLPLLLIAAVVLLGYVAYLRSQYPVALTTTGCEQTAPVSRTYTVILIALGLLAALWTVGLYGEQVGVNQAVRLVDYLADQPSVTIYSTERIAVSGPGVVAATITQPESKYHYQYSDLRLLRRTSDIYLLLPAGWQHGQDPVFVLRDSDTIRVDIIAQ